MQGCIRRGQHHHPPSLLLPTRACPSHHEPPSPLAYHEIITAHHHHHTRTRAILILRLHLPQSDRGATRWNVFLQFPIFSSLPPSFLFFLHSPPRIAQSTPSPGPSLQLRRRISTPTASMSLARESAEMEKIHHNGPPDYAEPRHSFADHAKGRQMSVQPEDVEMVHADQNQLKRQLKGRHMQMIALYVSCCAIDHGRRRADEDSIVVEPLAPVCSLAREARS